MFYLIKGEAHNLVRYLGVQTLSIIPKFLKYKYFCSLKKSPNASESEYLCKVKIMNGFYFYYFLRISLFISSKKYLYTNSKSLCSLG